jgi:hypothetical protein
MMMIIILLGVTHVAVNADESDEPKHRGSIVGHQVLRQDREVGYQRLFQDYFSEILRTECK